LSGRGGAKIKNKIQNPLTIIAIFAGIAEVAGTAVLLGLPIELQRIFVWFVMLFPVILVILFYLILIFKTNVLYAPGDFNDERNYMELQRSKTLNAATHIIEEIKGDNDSKQSDIASAKKEVSVSIDKLDELSGMLSTLKENFHNSEESETYKYMQTRNSMINFIKDSGDFGVRVKDISGSIYPTMSFLEFKRILSELVNDGIARESHGRIYYVPLNK